MKDYIEYFTGLQRSYGVCKVDDGYIDEITGKKKWKHEWAKIPITNKDYEDHIKGNFILMLFRIKAYQSSLSYPRVVDYIYMCSPLGWLKQKTSETF
jgi:hypothetical protein